MMQEHPMLVPQGQPRSQRHFHARAGCNQASKAADLQKFPLDPGILKSVATELTGSKEYCLQIAGFPPYRDARPKPIRSINGCVSVVTASKKPSGISVQRET